MFLGCFYILRSVFSYLLWFQWYIPVLYISAQEISLFQHEMMFLWTSFVTIGVKLSVLYVWPAPDIKALTLPVAHMHFALASNRTQIHVIDFRRTYMTRIRNIYVGYYCINHQHFLHPLWASFPSFGVVEDWILKMTCTDVHYEN